ncbi:hypothetical protein NST84_21895 [Paenibacillus sp. FSL R7-0345]|uniref:hypothetical protein n=1 Tax=Paenibacillus sp. FSL R7-0345 TaxID=2954535 RepID=UPI003159A650
MGNSLEAVSGESEAEALSPEDAWGAGPGDIEVYMDQEKIRVRSTHGQGVLKYARNGQAEETAIPGDGEWVEVGLVQRLEPARKRGFLFAENGYPLQSYFRFSR